MSVFKKFVFIHFFISVVGLGAENSGFDFDNHLATDYQSWILPSDKTNSGAEEYVHQQDNNDVIKSLILNGLDKIESTIASNIQDISSEASKEFFLNRKYLQKRISIFHECLQKINDEIVYLMHVQKLILEIGHIEQEIQSVQEQIEKLNIPAPLPSVVECQSVLETIESGIKNIQEAILCSKNRHSFYSEQWRKEANEIEVPYFKIRDAFSQAVKDSYSFQDVISDANEELKREETLFTQQYNAEQADFERQESNIKNRLFSNLMTRIEYDSCLNRIHNQKNMSKDKFNNNHKKLHHSFVVNKPLYEDERLKLENITARLNSEFAAESKRRSLKLQELSDYINDSYAQEIQPLKSEKGLFHNNWGPVLQLSKYVVPVLRRISKFEAVCKEERVSFLKKSLLEIGGWDSSSYPSLLNAVVIMKQAIHDLQYLDQKTDKYYNFIYMKQRLEKSFLHMQSEINFYKEYKNIHLQDLGEKFIQAKNQMRDTQEKLEDLYKESGSDYDLSKQSDEDLISLTNESGFIRSLCFKSVSDREINELKEPWSLLSGKQFISTTQDLDTWLEDSICLQEHSRPDLKQKTLRSLSKKLQFHDLFDSVQGLSEDVQSRVIDTLRACICEAEVDVLHRSNSCGLFLKYKNELFEIEKNGSLVSCFDKIDCDFNHSQIESEDPEIKALHKRIFHLYTEIIETKGQDQQVKALYGAYAVLIAAESQENDGIRSELKIIALELVDFAADISPLGISKGLLDMVVGVDMQGRSLSLDERIMIAMTLPPGLKVFEKGLSSLKSIEKFLRKKLKVSKTQSIYSIIDSAKKVPGLADDVADLKKFAEVSSKYGKSVETVGDSLKSGKGLFGNVPKVARDTLGESQLKNLKRFEKKLPAGSKPVTIHKEGANTYFKGEVPGNVPGSKAVYEKVVDGSGKTTSYTKTTYTPEGKIAHIKDKIDGSVIVPE